MAAENSQRLQEEWPVQGKDAGAKAEAPAKMETLSELLARHQKEIKELHAKELVMKQAAAKGSKAEQKAKKKQVEEEISKLDTKIRARHTKELAILSESSSEEAVGVNGMINAFSGLSTLVPQVQRLSKAQKRREKKSFLDTERELRIQEEQINMVSDRAVEDQQLEDKLQPLGLMLKEIKPDGHCLYRAIEDQLSLCPTISQLSYQDLREMAASYMRTHREEFIPFMGFEHCDGEAGFESYCHEVESTAAWGGQLELGALAHCLKRHIIVYSGDLPVIEMGKEYESLDVEGGESGNPSLRLSYHRHAFGLGEHYNSVVPYDSLSSPGLPE